MQGSNETGMKPGYRALLAEIALMARETAPLTGLAEFSPQVMAAMGRVPRHLFVPAGQEAFACGNHPLSIGYGQTISQPYIVALMTELLRLDKTSRVLEIGSGCGYQTAVLAELAGQVYSIEIVEPLGRSAAARLMELGYRNAVVQVGDGNQGWPEHAPYDAMIVTAATPRIPPPLLDQLRPGGRLVIPVGRPFQTQELVLVQKDEDSGRIHESSILPVSFVPLTGGQLA